MVSITTTVDTGRVIDMSDPALVEFTLPYDVADSFFRWFAGGTHFVAIDGTGLTYSGSITISDSSGKLSGGTISGISIDTFTGGAGVVNVELDITGTNLLNATNIDKDDARLFWNEVLKGDDDFNLPGLAESQVGLGRNVIFGDDYASATSSFAGITDRGGNDTITGADNIFDLYGDILTVEGKSTSFHGIPIINRAEYVAGDDIIVSATTDRLVKIIGDAGLVDGLAVLHAGDDFLDNSKCTAVGAITVGDVLDQEAGSVDAGNDTILAAVGGLGIGDVATLNGGTLDGGADNIAGSTGANLLSGDVDQLSASATLAGGDDTIAGGAGNDLIYGEYVALSAGDVAAVSGGRDVLKGGAGNDQLFGQTGADQLFGGAGADLLVGGGGKDTLSGGHGADQLKGSLGADRINGGAGADQLHGDKGTDTLAGGHGADKLQGGSGKDHVNGGPGNDILLGGAGADLFVFTPGTGRDHMGDFTDANTASDDRIDVRAYGFKAVSDIAKTASGNDLVLHLGDTDRVVVDDYLADHAKADINDDLLI